MFKHTAVQAEESERYTSSANCWLSLYMAGNLHLVTGTAAIAIASAAAVAAACAAAVAAAVRTTQ